MTRGRLARLPASVPLAETSRPLREPTPTRKGSVGIPHVHVGRGSRVWPLKQRVPHRSPNHRTPTTGRSVALLCGWGRGRGSPTPPRGHSWWHHPGRHSLAQSCLPAAERQVQWRGGPLLPTQRFRAPRPLSCLQGGLATRSWTSGVRPSTAASLLSDLWQLA